VKRKNNTHEGGTSWDGLNPVADDSQNSFENVSAIVPHS